jgi:Tol biopolymer transport system component
LTETTDATGSYQDENPDWSPNGAEIVFDSTRGGSNHTIWTLTNLNSGTLTATPLWPGQVGAAGGTHKSATEPVFSPDGTEVAFVQPGPGTNVWDGEIVGMGNPIANEQDVSLSTQGTGTENYQPDWQPLSNPNGGETPEVPLALMLPGSALLIGGLAVAQRRRSTLRATRRRTA